MKSKSIQSLGGEARAKALSSERRSAIASKAATSRWSGKPKAERVKGVPSFTIKIQCSNAAFCHNDGTLSLEGASNEVAAILRDIAKHLEAGDYSRRLQDSNGNHVGGYTFRGFRDFDHPLKDVLPKKH